MNLNKEEIKTILNSLRIRQGMYEDEKSRLEVFHETQYERYTMVCKEIEKYENLIKKLSKEKKQ